MRLLMLGFWCALSLCAQDDLWSHILKVEWDALERGSASATIPAERQQAIVKLLRSRQAPWICGEEGDEDWWNKLRFRSLPLSTANDVILVEAGPGCARGGQGSNGAMWLVRMERDGPALLATPDEISGFLYSIEPTSRNGYRDIVIGWHMSASDTGVVYLRFDGAAYKPVNAGMLQYDQDRGTRVVVPQ